MLILLISYICICIYIHIYIYICRCIECPSGSSGKELPCQFRRHKRWGFDPWVGNIPWRSSWQPTPVFLPGVFQGQWNLAGYGPQGHKDSTQLKCLSIHMHVCVYKMFCKYAMFYKHTATKS